MLIRVRGYNEGFGDYLRTGQKAGNKLHRDQLDKRVMLHGDLATTEKIVESMPDTGDDRYLHITLAFKEDYISEEILHETVKRFKEQMLSAYSEDEYALYAEAHLPKIKSVINEKTGQYEDRKPHIHIIIPKINLLDGKYLNPFGYYPHNVKYVEAFQEVVNHELQLESPRDNHRGGIHDLGDFISRYKGDFYHNDVRGIKEKLLLDILENKDINYDSFVVSLRKEGVVKVRNPDGHSYLNFRKAGEKKGLNLKEYVFSREFLNKPYRDKLNVVLSRQKGRDVERKELDYHNDIQRLSEWTDKRSLEIRFLHPGSKEFKNYKKLDEQSQINYLHRLRTEYSSLKKKYIPCPVKHQGLLTELLIEGLKENFHVRKRSDQKSALSDVNQWRGSKRLYSKHSGYGQFVSLYSVRKLLTGNMDADNQTGMLSLWSNQRHELGQHGEQTRISTSLRLPVDRTVSGNGRRRPGTRGLITETVWSAADTWDFDSLNVSALKFNRGSDNVAGSLRSEMASIILSANEKEKLKQLREHISAIELLKQLEHSHGIRREEVHVVKGRDGFDRIRCGRRTWSINDYLTKELNLNWQEARELLIQEFQRQQAGELLNVRKTPAIDYWSQFKTWQNENGNRYVDHLEIFRADISQRRSVFNRAYRVKTRSIWSNEALTRLEKRAAIAGLRLEKIKSRELLEADLRAARKEFQSSMRTESRYCEFLNEIAQRGDPYALEELRRFSRRSEERRTGGNYIESGEESRPFVFTDITYKVTQNGTVNYLRGEKLIIQDTREWISVVENNDEDAVELGIRLALEKNGNQALTLTGNDEFKKRVIKVALERNIYARFSDEKMQEEFDRRNKELRQNGNSNKNRGRKD